LFVGKTNEYGREMFTVFGNEDLPVYVTDANQVTITNTYDVLSRLTTLCYPDIGVVKFGYWR